MKTTIYPGNDILKSASPAVFLNTPSRSNDARRRTVAQLLLGAFQRRQNRRGRRLHFWLALSGGVQ